MEIDLNLGF